MRRREFLGGLGGAAAALPSFAARAQQSAMPVVGFLNGAAPELYAHLAAAFSQGLRDAGYVEGQNVAIEYRWARGQWDRFPAMATDLVARRVALIAAAGAVPGIRAAKSATSTIPIVFVTGGDPVKLGLVPSLSRPNGNVTGIVLMLNELGKKRLELLRELFPTAGVIGILMNPDAPNTAAELEELLAEARARSLEVVVVYTKESAHLNAAFEMLARRKVGALLINGDSIVLSQRDQIAALAIQHAIPTINPLRDFTFAGGLVSYGSSIADAYRQAGIYSGRILGGIKPSDLPVLQPTKFELVINLKTAKALGVTVPPTLLATADEVIE